MFVSFLVWFELLKLKQIKKDEQLNNLVVFLKNKQNRSVEAETVNKTKPKR